MSSSNDNAVATLNVLNLVAYIGNIALVMGVPSLFGLPDNAELSAKYQTLVTPAGWAFAIWGLIFTMQAIWSTIQVVLPSIRTNPLVVQGVAYNYIAVCVVQIGWTFTFALEQMTFSLFWMVAILYFLSQIYVEQNKVLGDYDDETYSRNYWLLRFPFNLHLGWIVAATLVNTNVVLVACKSTSSVQFTAAVLTVIIASVAAFAALYMQKDKTRPDVTIPLVLVWALNAISKELNSPKDMIISTFSGKEIGVIQTMSSLSSITLLISTVGLVAYALWRNRGGGRPEESSLLSS